MKPKSPVRDLLVVLFERLESEKITYCVLRNYEDLPDMAGNDLDLLVSPRQAQTFEDLVRRILQETGWRLLKKIQRYGYRSYWMYEAAHKSFIHVDVFQKIMWKGLRFADEDLFLQRRERSGIFHVPAPEAEAGTLLLKDLLQYGSVKEKYYERIARSAENNPEAFLGFLAWGLGEGAAALLLAQVLGRRWERIRAMKGRMRCALAKTSLSRSPAEVFQMTMRFLWGHLHAAFSRPQGFFIVFIGPDGSGKTTIATQLAITLAGLFPECLFVHSRFGILRNLRHYRNVFRRMTGRRALPASPRGEQASHDIPPHSRLRVMLYLAYYGLDYFLGRCIVRKARSRGILLLFDRYYYDYFIQDALAKLPRCMFRPLAVMLPQPDLVVYLSCPPDVILERKPELSREQIMRQQKRCEEIIKEIPYATVLSTVCPLEEGVAQIASRIIATMEKRQISHHKM